MRKLRKNYSGCYHHIMSRGYEGRNILGNYLYKKKFKELLEFYSYRNSMDIYGWCIMDNHYHLILYNRKGLLSKFMKELNGSFALWYRSKNSERGVVFDGRFKSTAIENDEYLLMSLLYLYQNPVRAGLVENAEDYTWSSLNEFIFSKNKSITNIDLLLEFYDSKENLKKLLSNYIGEKISINSDRWGESLGSNLFRFHSLKNANRRKLSETTTEKRRIKDRIIKSSKEIIDKFVKENNINKKELEGRTHFSSKLRGKLLIILRDECGLQLNEIHKLFPYRHLALSSMGRLYKKAKENNK
jgi:REP element-mobilizing transposase RayT